MNIINFSTAHIGDTNYPVRGFASCKFGDLILTSCDTGGNVCLVRINKLGQSCYYCTVPHWDGKVAPSAFNGASYVRELPNNQLLINYGGGIVIVTIPYYFVPGGVILIKAAAVPFIAPCGADATANRIYVDSNTGNYAIGFVEGFPLAYNLWVTVYNSRNEVITSGFVGNFPNGQDPINNVNASFPPYTYTGMFSWSVDPTGVPSFGYNNGSVVFCNTGYAGAPFQKFGYSNIGLNYSGLVCGEARNVVSAYSRFVFSGDVSGGLGEYATLGGIVNWPGIFTVSGTIFVFNTSYSAFLNPTNGNFQNHFIDNDGTFIGVNPNGSSTGIYKGVFDLNPFIPPPVVQNVNKSSLLNMHRPVSVLGNFKT